MWKKEDGVPGQPPVGTMTSPEAPRAPETRSTGRATIGPSIVVRGEVSGNEDLLIQGQLDGSVALGLNTVTVGGGGRVKADITGRVITIEGNVEGNLNAKEQIILRGSAVVQGDIKAPRVVLEDGASFRGLVDMGMRDVTEGAESRRTDDRAPAAVTTKPDAGNERPQATTPTRPVAPKGKDATGTGVSA
ncbi:MAG: polymer-forming cytoskeletal protein [Gemmatimonadales bacterium]